MDVECGSSSSSASQSLMASKRGSSILP
jgi:hypothetical protein